MQRKLTASTVMFSSRFRLSSGYCLKFPLSSWASGRITSPAARVPLLLSFQITCAAVLEHFGIACMIGTLPFLCNAAGSQPAPSHTKPYGDISKPFPQIRCMLYQFPYSQVVLVLAATLLSPPNCQWSSSLSSSPSPHPAKYY